MLAVVVLIIGGLLTWAHTGDRLCGAVASGNVGQVRLLLLLGADPSRRQSNTQHVPDWAAVFYTPLGSAAWRGDQEMVRAMLMLHPSSARNIGVLNNTLEFGENNKLQIAKMLLSAGADPRKRDVYGKIPLHYLGDDSVKLLPLLLIKGVDINARDRDGRTLLDMAHMASRWDEKNNRRMVAMLEKYHAD